MIEMKVEEAIKPLGELCDKLVKMATTELEQNPQQVDTHEMYEVVDMIKDLCEAKKEVTECMYKQQIMVAMDEHKDEYGETWDEEGKKFYRGQPRNEMGQFKYDGKPNRKGYGEMIPLDVDTYRNTDPKTLRDMDRHMGRMYYNGDDHGDSLSINKTRMATQMEDNPNTREAMAYTEGYRDGQRTNKRDYTEGQNGVARKMYFETKKVNQGNTQEENTERMKSLENFFNALAEDVHEMAEDMSPQEKSYSRQRMNNLSSKL